MISTVVLHCFTFLGDHLRFPWMHTAGCRGYGAGGRRGVQGMVQGWCRVWCRVWYRAGAGAGAGVGAGGLGAPLSS